MDISNISTKFSKTNEDEFSENGNILVENGNEPEFTDTDKEKNIVDTCFGQKRSPKSFKDWKMLIYVMKSSSGSYCRAWDPVIIGRDDSDRLVRKLRSDSSHRDIQYEVSGVTIGSPPQQIQSANPSTLVIGHIVPVQGCSKFI
ncbi:hypothetical protein TNCV_3184631 [Trichonephila clavipes]|nr:hypothetical protein TNCV_3184631 [Trichonephila clavipes]